MLLLFLWNVMQKKCKDSKLKTETRTIPICNQDVCFKHESTNSLLNMVKAASAVQVTWHQKFMFFLYLFLITRPPPPTHTHTWKHYIKHYSRNRIYKYRNEFLWLSFTKPNLSIYDFSQTVLFTETDIQAFLIMLHVASVRSFLNTETIEPKQKPG